MKPTTHTLPNDTAFIVKTKVFADVVNYVLARADDGVQIEVSEDYTTGAEHGADMAHAHVLKLARPDRRREVRVSVIRDRAVCTTTHTRNTSEVDGELAACVESFAVAPVAADGVVIVAPAGQTIDDPRRLVAAHDSAHQAGSLQHQSLMVDVEAAMDRVFFAED